MSWFAIILVSYFILSISNLVDKVFLSRIVTESIVYAVWVSFLSVMLVGLFVLHWTIDSAAYSGVKALGELNLMTPWFVFVSVIVGILFTFSIYLLYTALQKGEASRVIPLIGGSMPIIIYLLTFWYAQLDRPKMIAFIFLVAGTILVSLAPKSKKAPDRHHDILLALGASFSFAIFFVAAQYLFTNQGFINGIVWPRLGSALSLTLLLAFPDIRRKVMRSLRHLSVRLQLGWLSSQALGALGFLGQQYALSIPGVSVALVSALQSIQYAFILIFATAVSLLNPKLLREFISAEVIVQKVIALSCIGIGLYFIAS